MNATDLNKLGIPSHLSDVAFKAFRTLSKSGQSNEIQKQLAEVIAYPIRYTTSSVWGDLANGLVAHRQAKVVSRTAPFKIWGTDIDIKAIEQIEAACRLPIAVAGALMPDAHVGYGLPIGGVLATEDAIIPYAVGVDIACRVKLTVLDISPSELGDTSKFEDALRQHTHFGIGCELPLGSRNYHPVMDNPMWNSVPLLRSLKDKAWRQLGTSGSGNHFVEFGILHILANNELGLDVDKLYVAIMSHSGSRGPGASVCKYYNSLAKQQLPDHASEFSKLAWLPLHSGSGVEYWNAMTLMGEYASANHQLIHEKLVAHLAANVLFTIENHHNFAHREILNNQEVIVHRKGATPAHVGVLGVIPGDMVNPTYVVKGKGLAASINSASHGAGRAISRTQAKDTMKWDYWGKFIQERGVKLMSASIVEVPGAYKDIRRVMEAQADLVSIVAEFKPKVVRMSAEEEAED